MVSVAERAKGNMRFGNLVNLSTLTLDESTKTSWIQAMPIGKYQHPQYGEINITPERVSKFADNVNKGARGQQLDIDYDHKEYGGKAAGWVQKAEARPDGLWILVEWVSEAYSLIKEKAYKYFSPEFVDEWKHPSSGTSFSDVLLGGGITNRPFLKGILPLNLSEKFAESNSEGNYMFTDEQRAALIAQFNLAADAEDQAILEALIAAQTSAPAPNAPESADEPSAAPGSDAQNPTGESSVQNAPGTPTAVTVKFSEDETAKLLAEPTTKKLFEALESQAKVLKEMQDTSTVAAIVKKFSDKGLALPPVVEDALTETIKLSDNDRTTGAVIQMLSKLAEVGFVQLGENPSTAPSVHNSKSVDASKSLSEKAAKLAKDSGISFGEAMVAVVNENPDVYDAHRTNSYITS